MATKARKLTVTTKYGTFTRTTARDYGYVVATLGKSPQEVARHCDAMIEGESRYLAEYQAVLDSGQVPAKNRSTITLADYERYAVNAKAAVARWTESKGPAVANAERRIAELDGGLIGWSGTLANALKAATRAASDGFVGILIFDVNTGEAVR